MQDRYLKAVLMEDALYARKMAFISGPRQVGKTTLAKSLLQEPRNYLSWHQTEFRRAWVRSPAP